MKKNIRRDYFTKDAEDQSRLARVARLEKALGHFVVVEHMFDLDFNYIGDILVVWEI